MDINKAQEILDHDHYGLKKVKDRILELLAVRKLAPDVKAQIICLVGPPGVGKTSIARSIARCLHRKYVRTRPRSAATAAPTSAPCPARSSAP